MVSNIFSQIGSRFQVPTFSMAFLCGVCTLLPQSKNMRIRSTGSKLFMCVNVSVSGCLSLCFSPVKDWRPVQDVYRVSPKVSCYWLQLTHDLAMNKRIDGWIDRRPNLCCHDILAYCNLRKSFFRWFSLRAT